jgi:hypothetical protein
MRFTWTWLVSVSISTPVPLTIQNGGRSGRGEISKLAQATTEAPPLNNVICFRPCDRVHGRQVPLLERKRLLAACRTQVPMFVCADNGGTHHGDGRFMASSLRDECDFSEHSGAKRNVARRGRSRTPVPGSACARHRASCLRASAGGGSWSRTASGSAAPARAASQHDARTLRCCVARRSP